MKEKMKKQNGLAAIAIVLIVIVAVLVAGVAFLGVRTVVTGEHFLQPFAELGLIELEEEEENKNVENRNEERPPVKNEEEENVKAKGQESSLLLAESEEVNCYTITVDIEELADAVIPYVEAGIQMYMSMGATDETATAETEAAVTEMIDMIKSMVKGCELVLDVYADGNDVKQAILTFEYEGFVENVYETMKDTEDFEYESYEDCLAGFEDEVLSELTTENLQTAMAEDETAADYAEYLEVVAEDGKIQISVDLREVDLDSYIGEYSEELTNLGIDTENVVESAVKSWNEYIDENGYDGLMEELMALVESQTTEVE